MRSRLRPLSLLLTLSLSLATLWLSSLGCVSDEAITQLRLLVSAEGTQKIATITTSLSVGADQRSQEADLGGRALGAPERILIRLPDAWADQEVSVALIAITSTQQTLVGNAMVKVSRAATTNTIVTLTSACHGGCTIGERRCQPAGVARCERGADGCPNWSPTESCPTDKPYCSNGTCAITCVDECGADQRRCADEKHFRQCGNHDSDSCRDWSAAISCAADESCRSEDGQCIKTCAGAACTCTAGSSEVCPDKGECKGGKRTCDKDGKWGPCVWTQGPQAESCDGKDNDCDGDVDELSDLSPPACSEQRGVCQGATQACAGTSGWQSCDSATFVAHAAKSGKSYESDESSCDGEDNDCDGASDEPAKCCQRDCTNKACGADDGCGNSCKGSCVGDATCSWALAAKVYACKCNRDLCGSSCCDSGEQCRNNVCEPLTPSGPWVVPVTFTSSGSTKRYGPYRLAIANDGSVLTTGHYFSVAYVSNTTAKSSSWQDLLLARLKADSTVEWIRNGYDDKSVTSTTKARAYHGDVAVDSASNSVYTGAFEELLTFDGTQATSAGQGIRSSFVVKLKPDGTLGWLRSFGNAESQAQSPQVATLSNGDVIVAGFASGTVGFDGTSLTKALYLARLKAADGAVAWIKPLISGGSQWTNIAERLRVGANDRIYLIGKCATGSQVLGTTLNATHNSFVAALKSDGTAAWVLGGISSQIVDLALTSTEDLIVVGSSYSDVSFGNATSKVSSNSMDVYVASIDKTGDANWVVSFGGSNSQLARAVVVDKSDRIIVAGQFDQQMDASVKTLSGDNIEGFILRLNANGTIAAARSFGSKGQDQVESMAYDAKHDRLVLVGTMADMQLTLDGITIKGRAPRSTDYGNDAWVWRTTIP
ncbi:MAG: hypothetical protein H6707_06915 [Deltaproteobacteria bacterium]|nr:hypothetical protein [Deltaproteobacteria bacterium]